jgi:hypothetical protein
MRAMVRRFYLALVLMMGWASQAFAVPERTMEDIEYLTYEGALAIEVGFSAPVQVLSQFPLERGATVQLFLGPRMEVDQEIDALPFVQVLDAPPAKDVPLKQVVLTINEKGDTTLTLSFEEVVRYKTTAGRGANSVLIVLPDIPSERPAAAPAVPKKKITPADNALKAIFLQGRDALKAGENRRAIQVFTKLLSKAPHEYTQDALELLGVARERNGQTAHAKAIYQEYLNTYAGTEGGARVKQRLADLLSGQLKPKARLKVLEEAKEEDAFRSTFYGSFSQYYYYGKSSTDGAETTVDQSLLLNQLSLNWRLRNEDYDIRNFVYTSQSEDFATDAGRKPALETAYSQIKNSRAGFSGRIGRQTGSGGGVLGKFDGLRASYDLRERLGLNAVAGYPVDIGNKRSLQTNKPFWGLGLEFDGDGLMMDILPYYIHQDIDGITDREAVGSEFRYFHELGNYYSLIDYDISYNDLNIYIFRGQYNWRRDTVFNFNFDYRNSPLLFTSDALIGRTDVSTIDELLEKYDEDLIRRIAESRVGNASTVSFGISHTLNAQYQINADITHSLQVFMVEDTLSAMLEPEHESQTYLFAQLIASKWLNERDTTVLGLRLSQTSAYDELSLSASNRLPFYKRWQFDARLRLDLRENESGEDLSKWRPSVRMLHRASNQWYFEAELGMEWWRYGGETNNTDYRRSFASLGYRWNF